MLELGHILALTVRKRPVKVRLVLSNADLVDYYKKLFEDKQALADDTVEFEW